MAFASFNKSTGVPGKMKPTLWAETQLKVQEAELIASQLMDSASHEKLVSQGGDAIVYNDQPSFAARAYIVDSPITYDLATENSKLMYLDQFLYSAVRTDYVDKNQAFINPVGVHSTRCLRALMEAKDRSMLDIAADGPSVANTFGSPLSPIQLNSENVLDFLATILLRLADTNASSISKTKNALPNIVLPPSVHMLLSKHCEKRQTTLGDATIKNLDFKVYNNEINIYQSNNLSFRNTTATNKSSHKIFGGYKDAFAHATQVMIKDENVKLVDFMADAARFLVVYGQTNLYPSATFSAFITT